ncbi:hypothetical protein CHUAL_007752 [Chamberlinius hualienensis]
MDDIIEAIENLKLWTSDLEQRYDTVNFDDVISSLNQMVEALTKDGNDKTVIAEKLSQNNVNTLLSFLIIFNKRGDVYDDAKEKSAEIAAELSKTDVGRSHCSNSSLINSLLVLLSSDNNSIIVQACRALGNICYDNDYGRSIVNELQGCDKLIRLLQSQLTEANQEQLRTVSTGFLLNLINNYDLTMERLLDLNLIDMMCNYITKFAEEDDVCLHVLLILNCLADNEIGRKKLIEKNICDYLVSLMDVEISSDVVEAVLDLVGNLAEDDVVKYQLAKTGLCNNLLKILKTTEKTEEESVNVVKISCDLIVLLLTGDESMSYLYNDGKGLVYQECIQWLSSSNDTLQTAAALAIGNFARKDENCIKMVAEGISGQLINVIRKHNGADGDIQLQHAILSAIRNLAIPSVNKRPLLDLDVIDAILPMINVKTFPVVFKLLGAMRMLMDGQNDAAISLGTNMSCISRIIEWCETDDHPGVKGEANRLLAWIIKNSKSSEVMKLVVDKGGLPFLVSMMNSEHSVMQNEALIALAIVCVTIIDRAEDSLVNTEFAKNLKSIISEEMYGPEVRSNALTLASAACKSGKLKSGLIDVGIKQLVSNLSSSDNQIFIFFRCSAYFEPHTLEYLVTMVSTLVCLLLTTSLMMSSIVLVVDSQVNFSPGWGGGKRMDPWLFTASSSTASSPSCSNSIETIKRIYELIQREAMKMKQCSTAVVDRSL